MHTLTDLDGVNTARGRVNAESVALTISAPSGFSEGAQSYYPAESITLTSIEAVRELGDVCAAMVARHEELLSQG